MHHIKCYCLSQFCVDDSILRGKKHFFITGVRIQIKKKRDLDCWKARFSVITQVNTFLPVILNLENCPYCVLQIILVSENPLAVNTRNPQTSRHPVDRLPNYVRLVWHSASREMLSFAVYTVKTYIISLTCSIYLSKSEQFFLKGLKLIIEV